MIEPTRRAIVKGNLFKYLVSAGTEVLGEFALDESFTAYAETVAEQLSLVVPEEKVNQLRPPSQVDS